MYSRSAAQSTLLTLSKQLDVFRREILPLKNLMELVVLPQFIRKVGMEEKLLSSLLRQIR